MAETPDGNIDAPSLLVEAAQRAELKQRSNSVGKLAGGTAGSFSFSNGDKTLAHVWGDST